MLTMRVYLQKNFKKQAVDNITIAIYSLVLRAHATLALYLCLVCVTKLTNDAMIRSKLKRHLDQATLGFKGKNDGVFILFAEPTGKASTADERHHHFCLEH